MTKDIFKPKEKVMLIQKGHPKKGKERSAIKVERDG